MARARLSEAQRFGLRFFGILIGAGVLSWAVGLPAHLGPLQRALAGTAGWLAHLTGGSPQVFGDQILLRTLTVDINYECTGAYVLLILFTFLLAYPAPWRARATGALLGAAGLTLINVLRIAFLVRIAEVQPGLFETLHEYVWQGIFLVLVIAYAVTWVDGVRR